MIDGLATIRVRASEHAACATCTTTEAILQHDVPALIVEVERLTLKLLASNVCVECDCIIDPDPACSCSACGCGPARTVELEADR